MGDPEGGPLPSGLVHTQAAAYADSFIKSRSVDDARWKQAEERTAELIKRIRGTRSSEARRKDVADYVRHLIQKSFDCQVRLSWVTESSPRARIRKMCDFSGLTDSASAEIDE